MYILVTNLGPVNGILLIFHGVCVRGVIATVLSVHLIIPWCTTLQLPCGDCSSGAGKGSAVHLLK